MLAKIASALRSHESIDFEKILAREGKPKENKKPFRNLSFFEKLKMVGG